MNEVSSEVGLSSTGTVTVAGLLPRATTVGTEMGSFTGTIVSPAMGVPLFPGVPEPPIVGSRLSREGVWDLEGAFDELRELGLAFCERRKSSRGISSERGRGTRGLGVPERFREASRDFGAPTAIGWLLSLRGLELFRRAPVASPSIERLELICTRLTLPDGILSRRSAAATPGTRFAVENKGRCSLGCRPLLGRRIDADLESLAFPRDGNAASLS